MSDLKPEDLIIPGLGVAGDLGSAVLQGISNRKQRKWNEKIMERQRGWALEDWNMQNAYNSPAAQMDRLKAAGLNPNLVYGHGADAQSSAMPRNVEGKSYEPKAPRIDLGGPAMMYLQQQQIQKEMALKDAQIATGWNDASLRNAQILATMQGVEGAKWDLGQRQRLADSIFEKLRADIDSTRVGIEATKTGMEKTEAETARTKIGTQIDLDRNDREKAMNAQNIAESISRVIKNKMETGKIEYEIGQIMQSTLESEDRHKLMMEELKLKKQGMQWGDNIWWRKITEEVYRLREAAKGRVIKSSGKTPSGLEYKRY